jgi:hypothetical protein
METFSDEDYDGMILELKSKIKETKLLLFASITLIIFELILLFLNKFKLDYMFLTIVLFLFFQIYMNFVKLLEQQVALRFIIDLKKNNPFKKKQNE